MQFNLTGIQKQFWALARLHPASAAYHIVSCVKITGDLDKAKFREAWETLFCSADIFKTAYQHSNGTPVAVIHAKIEAPWVDISCTENEFAKLCTTYVNEPFDLERPPLVRTVLFDIGRGMHYFLLIQHHIITDLTSKRLIGESISSLYNQKPVRLPSNEYGNLAKKESDYLGSDKGKTSLNFWKNKIDQYAGPLDLPTPFGNRSIFRGEGASVGWTLPLHLTDRLNHQIDSEKRQPFLWLLSGYIALLHRISGQNQFAVGVPLTNRRLEGASDVLGPLVNILPVYVDIAPDDTFLDLYAKIRKEMLFNHRHQEVPFIDIAGFYRGARELSRPPLIQAGFTSEPLFELELNGLTCQSIPIQSRGAQMDLFFTYWPAGDSYSGWWEYNSDLLSEEIVADWQDCFNVLLEQTLKRPAAPLANYQILSRNADTRLERWNTTFRQYPLQETLAHNLRRSFAAHPDQTALIYGDHRWSYAQMERIVCCQASQLKQAYGERNRIALLLSQSPGMVLAIHAVLQSGNAYVPIGIDWPVERIRTIVEDVRPAAIITEDQYEDIVAPFGIPVIPVNSFFDQDPQEAIYPGLTIGPDDSTYIIYTSGSTGKPKGVELPHNGVLNRILWMQDEYKLTPRDRVLQKTPYTFDVSVWEFIWPFFSGAGLVVTRQDGNKDPHYLKAIIRDERISVLHFVPSMLSIFLKVPGVGDLTGIRDVICSGEALTKGQEEQFYQTFNTARLHNLYGPTEASIDVTYWECGKDSEKDRSVVPIGRPIANTELYIVDQADNPCPPYVAGELLIGGVGLAKGYWNRPKLTSTKFIPNPFGPGRLYRTGDLARYRLDGTIEYLGRNDFQVKLRGLRIELGEIEAAIENHPSIERAVVTLWRKSETDERLIGYYTCQDNAADPAKEDLIALLKRTLPDYMLPSHFLWLEQMPINANGKLDRQALPLPEVKPLDSLILPPENETQKTIHHIWKDILSGGDFGIDDNFFDVGGSSLTIMELGLKLEKAFGREINALDLFRHPTIKEIATLFEQKSSPDMADQRSRAQAQRERLKGLRSKRKDRSNIDK